MHIIFQKRGVICGVCAPHKGSEIVGYVSTRPDAVSDLQAAAAQCHNQ